MKVSAVIPSVARPEALARAIQALERQTTPCSQIIVAVPASNDVPAGVYQNSHVKVVVSKKGAARQRNTGIRALDSDTDIVLFLDDDSVPRNDYVESTIQVYNENPGIVAVTGRMACDGAALKRELSPHELEEALMASHVHDAAATQTSTNELYGCNMSVRYEAVLATPFDEHLPLYSWLEDLDLARRLQQRGTIVKDTRCVVAHQGNASGGRTQHRRFGYSSVANPIYLVRKGSLTVGDLPKLIGRPVLGNFSKIISRTEGRESRARLAGQLLATHDLIHGRVTPERIETF